MKVDYKKDLKHNYMVVSDYESTEAEPYGIKMLKYQDIDGILPVEQRSLDNRVLLYYDITAKQSMAAIYEKAFLTKDKILKLCIGIIETMERAYEYLLPEDDFILDPEHIYMEVVTGSPVLCFLPGYNREIKEQMSSLMEYLMNKVDYNDREAVLLVYRLYAVSREDGYTLDHLRKELQESCKLSTNNTAEYEKTDNSMNLRKRQSFDDKKQPDHNFISSRDKDMIFDPNSASGKEEVLSHYKTVQETVLKAENNIPVMMEKLETEEEISCYPLITYIYTGVCIAVGVTLIILGLVSKILYNSYGDRIDCVKLAALLLIIFCVEGYLVNIIWNKKNKITRIVTRNNYVDPRLEPDHTGQELFKKAGIAATEKKNSYDSTTDSRKASSNHNFGNYGRRYDHSDTPVNCNTKFDADDNPTCLLNAAAQEYTSETVTYSAASCILKALDEANYQSIPITEFPFFIGKLKNNVDYCLEKDVISRYHAKITMEENHYYITDLNSTNGTFLNCEALKTYEKKELKEKDEISFANIKYRFERNLAE